MTKLGLQRRLILGYFFCALGLFGNVISGHGQKIDWKRPGVYLTFQEFVRKTGSEAHPTAGSRLVLHNNTRWSIYYGKWVERALFGDVPMGYVLEMQDGSVALRRHVEVVTIGKLAPGKAVSFTVPREDFPTKSKIYVEFYFSWEAIKGNRTQDEAVHRAYFFSSDLPGWP